MCRLPHKSGFTLIELLLVMLVIAIAAAIVAPSFSGFTRGRRLPNTATALVTVGRWCRVQAISSGVAYRLNIDTGSRRWWVSKDDDTGNFVDVTEELGREFVLPDGIEFGEVRFQSQMTADGNGSYITFTPGGRSDVVTIPLTCDNQVLYTGNDMPLGTFHIMTVAP